MVSKSSSTRQIREAQNRLGFVMKMVMVCRKDDVKSSLNVSKAAEQGDDIAQINLGCCYENGIGVEADETMATQWFRKKAAKQGNEYGTSTSVGTRKKSQYYKTSISNAASC